MWFPSILNCGTKDCSELRAWISNSVTWLATVSLTPWPSALLPPHDCVISPMLYSIHTHNWISTHLQIYHEWSWLWDLEGSSSPMTLSPSTKLQWEVPILTDPVQQCLAKHCTGLVLPTPGAARPEPPGLLEVQFTTATAEYSCSEKQFRGMTAKTERVRKTFSQQTITILNQESPWPC